MLQVTAEEIKKRLAFDNPWWEEKAVDKRFTDLPRRAYLPGFMRLVNETNVQRAVVLMGPRRVGKTVMIHQGIQQLLDAGVAPTSILYLSVDQPLYTGIPLEKLLGLFQEIHGHGRHAVLYVFYDEIQYHPDWERHLKALVDSYPDIRFVASGSAAAALKMKSQESGAGRFTDFVLPALSFAEFLRFEGKEGIEGDLDALNAAFVDYLNFGGFPEAVMKPEVRHSMDRYVAEDIVDKVLLRDLPSLYGVTDTQELKRLFNVLAYNTGQEINIEELSKSSQVAKNTIKKYLDYLETAFLICRIYRVDENARRFKKQSNFKVYLTNPSLRAALYGPVGPDDPAMGKMAETGLVSQFAHSRTLRNIHFARWKNGEVDFVFLFSDSQDVLTAFEVKWGRKPPTTEDAKSLISFAVKNKCRIVRLLSREVEDFWEIDGVRTHVSPLSSICYSVALVYIEHDLGIGIHPFTGKPLGVVIDHLESS